jgi:PPK2 family polyphosphate:nucleotide phosphotransferase
MNLGYRVTNREAVRLKDVDPEGQPEIKKAEAERRTAQLTAELQRLQELLYAVREQGVLIVLQGLDTSGKDGAIRHVFGPLDSQSCSVTAFKAPSDEERTHDFLWRVHAHVPAAGYIKIFNRSHYEDVLVARVHKLVPEATWQARYEHINAFERLLADSGVMILKFFLHISKTEQERRLLAREENPIKSWKLAVGDWKERECWDEYTSAYEDALNLCSEECAPWFIVPSDRKWFRNLAIAQTVRDVLMPFEAKWLLSLEEMGRERKKEIDAYRRGTSADR